ncbi:MAG: type I phosphomannose isomerase catalytic subunit [Candidatus Nanopelagicales bacterium]
MSELLVIEPVFAERVWGGEKLREWYGAKVPPGVIGECWAVSGLPGNAGVISAGAPAGMTLDQAWEQGLVTGEPREDDFPILCKLLDPADWLSVQVHPDDAQAQHLEGLPRGKAECWYVLAAEPGAELIIGHTAQTTAELREALADGRLMDLLIRHPVTAGSFFTVPAGCVHAVGPGVLVYEVQQSADITYRLYDFDRPGLDGKPRELHVEKGFDVVTAPYDLGDSFTAREAVDGVRILVDGDFFHVDHDEVVNALVLLTDTYAVVTVVAGEGEAFTPSGTVTKLERGVSFVIPAGLGGPLTMTGELQMIVTEPGRALEGSTRSQG